MSVLKSDAYAVIDVETTLKNKVGDNAAHPACPDNYAPYVGVRFAGEDIIHRQNAGHDTSLELHILPKIWVGQNFKFDLLYLFKANNFSFDHMRGVQIWDTQIAEYVLTGQKSLYSSLDELSLKYGGTLKDDRLKEFFKRGVGADEIPEKLITPYLINDLKNTEIVFLKQVEEAAKVGKLGLIMAMCDSLLMTTVMQHFGMRVDERFLDKTIDTLTDEVLCIEANTNFIMKGVAQTGGTPGKLMDEVVFTSPKMLSLFLFGGDCKYKVSEQDGFYKNGKPKMKLVEKVYSFPRKFNPTTCGSTLNKNGYYTVDEKVLENILSVGIMTTFFKGILEYREKQKQLSTYFERTKELVMNGFIYPNLNHCSTVTGRLSCTAPNLQNQTNGPIKKAFISSFDCGSLIDIDYNQLEMVGLAYISGCSALKNDLNSGVDMHSALFCDMYGRIPTKEERKPFKSLTFGLVYGAGYKTLAENGKCSEKDAKKFIETFYNRYPGVGEFHKRMIEDASKSSYVTAEMEDGHQIKKYEYKSPSGRNYVFRTYLNKRKNWKTGKEEVAMTFSPTELKNYPVQGFSTGDVVPIVLGKLYRWWISLDNSIRSQIKPVVTVHDSVVFDVAPDAVEFAKNNIPPIMVNVKKHLEDLDITDWDVTIKVGISEGSNWFECTEVGSFSS